MDFDLVLFLLDLLCAISLCCVRLWNLACEMNLDLVLFLLDLLCAISLCCLWLWNLACGMDYLFFLLIYLSLSTLFFVPSMLHLPYFLLDFEQVALWKVYHKAKLPIICNCWQSKKIISTGIYFSCTVNPLPQLLQNLSSPCILCFRSSLCEIFLLSSVVEPCLWHVLEMSVLSYVVSSKVSDVSGMCLFSSAVWFCLCDVSQIPLLFSVVSSSVFIWFHLSIQVLRSMLIFQVHFYRDISKTLLPSILTSTADIAPWLIFNKCLTKNFSRWNASVSNIGLEVDESIPSVHIVFNWVSAIKGDIYVKNVVMVGHFFAEQNIFCCMLLLCKHEDTFVGFTHYSNLCRVFHLLVFHFTFHIAEIVKPYCVKWRSRPVGPNIRLIICTVFGLVVCCLSSEVVVLDCMEWRLCISSPSILVCQVDFVISN